MGGLVDAVFGGGAKAPDYTPVAQASEEAAKIGAALGIAQLDEGKRQYDNNMAVARPIVDAQLQLMEQAKAQGDEYFNYLQTFRPLEQGLLSEVERGSFGENAGERSLITNLAATQADSMLRDTRGFSDRTASNIATMLARQGVDVARLRGETGDFVGRQNQMADNLMTQQGQAAQTMADRTGAFESDQLQGAADLARLGVSNAAELRGRTADFENDAKADIAMATGGNTAIQNRFKQDIDSEVARAVADARVGQTQAMNQAARTAMRYGVTLPTGTAPVTVANAQQIAQAANGTRNNATDRYRNLISQGIGLKSGLFSQAQAGMGDAMSREEGALADRLARGQQTFVTGQASMGEAMDRAGNAMQGNMGNRRDTFLTGQTAMSDAAGRDMDMMRTAYDMDRDSFGVSQGAMTGAFDRALSAARSSRDMRIQDQNLDFAKKLDVTGMVRGLPGASQGAYGVSINAGNSANANNQSPGNSYLSAVQGGIGTIQNGQRTQLSGLSNILNNQNQAYLTTRGQNLDVIGTGIGIAAGI